jgi:hypothetical protein
MADDENQEVTEQPKVAEESGGVLDLNSALQQVLKKAAAQPDGLARGLREAVKALDRKVVRCPWPVPPRRACRRPCGQWRCGAQEAGWTSGRWPVLGG